MAHHDINPNRCRLLFRQHGEVIQTRRPHGLGRLPQWGYGAAIVAALLLSFGYAGYLDERARQEDERRELQAARVSAAQQSAVLSAFDDGRLVGRAEMMVSATEAWQVAHDIAARCATGGPIERPGRGN